MSNETPVYVFEATEITNPKRVVIYGCGGAGINQARRFEGTVGSGGLRKEHVDLIADAVNEILSRLRPGDLNIVVSSLSGGSGSVIAPCLASELLARGLKVIVIGIGSNESEIRVRNSLNAIRSYANIAEETEKPVVMSLHFNSPKTPRYAVDYPMGFLITDGRLSKTVDVLNQTLQTYEERLAAVRPRNSGLVTNQEGRTKRGLVV